MAQISYGSITIVDTTDIQRFYVQYAQNNSSAVAPTTGWSQERPIWFNGSYIWQRTVTKRQGVALTSLDYGNPVCITGAKGDPGQQGNTGNGISSIVTMYCNYGSGTPSEDYQYWSSNVPEYDKDKPNYWVKTTINYTSGNPSVTVYKDLGITEAVEKANLANTTAQTAESHSIEAISIADSKNRIYYSSTFPTEGNYIDGDTLFKESSNGTVLYIYDKTYNDNVSGHWKQQQFEENAIANLAITNAKIKDLHGDKITANTIAANKLIAHSITTNQLATDAIKSSNYAAGTAPYSLTGTFLDLSNGNIFTPNFGVNNDSTDNINNGAYIKGTIQAYDGKIGSNNNNYWYIGNYFDYNQGQSAMIRSHGTAAIQLGDSGTWRLSTNRIHTAWNDDSTLGEAFRLHYPTYGGKYWDSGLHVPASATDKLLYIRNAATTISLENLQNDINDNSGGNYWNYQFYLTNDGSLYAKNIYIMDDNGGTVQIGGTDGIYLLKSGGIISGNLEITGTLKTQGNFLNRSGSAITLQTNLASTTAATLSGNSSSPIKLGITGTLPVANGGTGNTNYTSGGVVYVSNTNPKTLLSNAAGTSGQLLASGGSGVPTWVNASSLTVAAATKATQDGNGKVIATTYLPLTGGSITGPVDFGDSVSIDDLTAGTLVVTGNSSFTNNIQANTINGVAVGSSPKFTDTVTTVTTSGNGNAVTAITASGGKLTVTKETTFLTSYTQTDPVFKASIAASIKQTDIDNWNNKTSNVGTVTSIATSSPITGGTITSSGTIGHATSGVGNTITTIGFYKFKYDTYGHVTGVTSVAKADITGLGIPAQDTTYSNASTTAAGLMSSADKKKLDNIQVDSSGQAVAANVAGRWGIDVTFSDTNVAQIGHANSAITASNTQAAKITSSVTSTQLAFGDVINFPYVTYDTYGHVTGKTNLYFKMPAAPSSTGSATNDSDGNPINTTYIKKSIGTAAGDIIYWSASGTPVRLAKGSNGQVLKLANGVPTWGADNNTTYSAGTGLSLSGTTFNHSNSITAGTVSDGGSTRTLAFDGTFKIPSVTYDAQGHIKSTSTITLTMPSAPSSVSTADAFSSAATITLTGDTTGSASSTKGWSITTTTKKLSQTTTSALSSFTDATALIYTAYGGSNAITDKPTSVDAFGCLSFKTADGWYGQLLMSSNTATGLYWRTATALSGGWKKLLDSTNYTDYTVKKDGTGASGTWGISISGTAAKATADKNGNDITTKYVTMDTTQTISGRKTFSDLAAVTFKPSSGTDKCNINYDASLGALVFSF